MSEEQKPASMSGMCMCGCGRQLTRRQAYMGVKWATRACYDDSRRPDGTHKPLTAPPPAQKHIAISKCLACNGGPAHRILRNGRDGEMHMVDCQSCGRCATGATLEIAAAKWHAYRGAVAANTQAAMHSMRASHLPSAALVD